MPPPTFRTVVIFSVAGLGVLVGLILAFPHHSADISVDAPATTTQPFLPPPVLAKPNQAPANPAVFTAWNQAADKFLQQTWRSSRFSLVGAYARIGQPIPTITGSFDDLVAALPPAEFWPQLPDITRVRLQQPLPKTTAEALTWTDQHLLHAWALALNLPRTREELRGTLDDLRTVRWLADQNLLTISPGRELDAEFSNRLGVVDQKLRPQAPWEMLEGEASEVWHEVARRAGQSPREQLTEAVGEEMYGRLRAITRSTRFGQQLSHFLPFGLGSGSHPSDLAADPIAAALYTYGPLPNSATIALGVAVPGAIVRESTKVPELVPALNEQQALPLVAEALAAKADLDWANAPQTAVQLAHYYASGLLTAEDLTMRNFVDQLLSVWPEPVAPRAEAGLALLAKMSSQKKSKSLANDPSEIDPYYQQKRATCLIALGRGREADALLGETELSNWETLASLPPSAAAGVADFALVNLPRHQGMSLHWWELMEQTAAKVGRAPEALALLQAAASGAIDGNPEMLVVTATKDTGHFEAAANLLLEITQRPYTSDGWAPTERRTDALWQLLQLGEEQHRPAWTREALARLSTLVTYWQKDRENSSDGGNPWGRWPGKLAELGRLDLALATASLNVRWRESAADAGQAFLTSENDQRDSLVNGPAAALAGWVQVLMLQKKPQAVIKSLMEDGNWPARDLSEIALFSDASFAPDQQQPLGLTVADALTAVGRTQEAARVRLAVHPGWEEQIKTFLASPGEAALSEEQRVILRYLASNEVPSDVTLDLVMVARATEAVPFVAAVDSFPDKVFPLPAAAAKIDRELRLGEPVPMPPVISLRAFVISSASELVPLRNALLANVPVASP